MSTARTCATITMPPAPPEALHMVSGLRRSCPKFQATGVTWDQVQRIGVLFRSAQGLWMVTDCASQSINAIPLDGPSDPHARATRPFPVREQVFCRSTFHLLTLVPEAVTAPVVVRTAPAKSAKAKPRVRPSLARKRSAPVSPTPSA
jgi:hypothetical protein